MTHRCVFLKCHSRMSKGTKIPWLWIYHRVREGVAVLDDFFVVL